MKTLLITTAVITTISGAALAKSKTKTISETASICYQVSDTKTEFDWQPTSSPSVAADRVFVFDPSQHHWFAFENGKVVADGKASGGAHYCKDVGRSCRTPVGSFRVYRIGNAGCRSSRYPKPNGGAPMPYCVFFNGAYAIHGSPDVPNHHASHGCIRVKTADAKWLHKHFLLHGVQVIVKPYRQQKANRAKRNGNSRT